MLSAGAFGRNTWGGIITLRRHNPGGVAVPQVAAPASKTTPHRHSPGRCVPCISHLSRSVNIGSSKLAFRLIYSWKFPDGLTCRWSSQYKCKDKFLHISASSPRTGQSAYTLLSGNRTLSLFLWQVSSHGSVAWRLLIVHNIHHCRIFSSTHETLLVKWATYGWKQPNWPKYSFLELSELYSEWTCSRFNVALQDSNLCSLDWEPGALTTDCLCHNMTVKEQNLF